MTLYYLKLTGVKVARLYIFWKRFAQLGVRDLSATPRRRRETYKDVSMETYRREESPRFLGGFLHVCTSFKFMGRSEAPRI